MAPRTRLGGQIIAALVIKRRILDRHTNEMDKDHERAIVEAFLTWKRYPISSLKEFERPDWLLRLGDAIIGIEVTELVEATPRQLEVPQRWKREAERIVSNAKASFERRHKVALVVGIAFRPEWRPPVKHDAAKLSDGLATVVERLVPPEVLHGGPLQEAIERKHPHSDVEWIYVGPTKQSLGGRWQPSSVSNVQPASAVDIIKTVGNKEPKVKHYRHAAPSVWLLIDCDLSGQGRALDVPNPSFTISSSFDRVFCCDFGRWKWVEVPTVPPKTCPNQSP